MTKTLSVAAIQHGTVIDHIATDQTLRIMHMLKLLSRKRTVTVGFNLPSKRMKVKDLIKIENHVLTNKEANEVTVFAPEATINIIKDFEVTQKIITSLPPSISDVFICPNNQCITRHESVESFFHVEERGKQVNLVCHYCEKAFDRNEVKVKT
jgi:aspartate carbamoyltransferase regulatory subunit